ncbi:MAG: 16S rRNA (guanine(966)-N(2))-methyltransferase RsmD [Thiovulaceae bacterium]|nr:16S rRNA (guanine(966)-N(2))-methyltransferase RsmD [Sulfurimonadaceae bacterium]
MKNSTNFTKKIIAGKYKGKTLKLPSKTTTRTSKVIVLESFFNTIQFAIMDAIFIEVFSGSGSVGLEALSRGAKKIIFMEKDRDALKILHENIAQTDSAACEVLSGDSFTNIKTVINKIKNLGESAYLYIDPPFSVREGMEDIYDKMIELIREFPHELCEMVIIEHMSSLELPEMIGEYIKTKTKKFGNTSLTYYN